MNIGNQIFLEIGFRSETTGYPPQPPYPQQPPYPHQQQPPYPTQQPPYPRQPGPYNPPPYQQTPPPPGGYQPASYSHTEVYRVPNYGSTTSTTIIERQGPATEVIVIGGCPECRVSDNKQINADCSN